MVDYNRLAEDLNTYLNAKFPDVDLTVKMETSEYISHRVSRFLQDALVERDKEWRQSLKSQQRHFDKEIDRLRRQNSATNRGNRDGQA